MDRPHSAPDNAADPVRKSRGETILVVEDEASILKLTRKILQGMGYTVFTANTPQQAIALAEGHAGRIHMVITDVVMPEMSGRDLADRLHSLDADIKFLFMSGYTANAIIHRGVLDEGIAFIQKPFTRKRLAAKVQEVLNGVEG
jgi:CheY-like chemotaxis protein